jgi:outer membrane protein TolC
VTAVAKAEAATVRRQLHGLLKDREREAVKEIRSAVEEWISARDLVAIARKRYELCESRVTDLQKRSDSGMGVELDLRRARLETLKAEAELVGEIARWKQADVKTREVIGLLCECEPPAQ